MQNVLLGDYSQNLTAASDQHLKWLELETQKKLLILQFYLTWLQENIIKYRIEIEIPNLTQSEFPEHVDHRLHGRLIRDRHRCLNIIEIADLFFEYVIVITINSTWRLTMTIFSWITITLPKKTENPAFTTTHRFYASNQVSVIFQSPWYHKFQEPGTKPLTHQVNQLAQSQRGGSSGNRHVGHRRREVDHRRRHHVRLRLPSTVQRQL